MVSDLLAIWMPVSAKEDTCKCIAFAVGFVARRMLVVGWFPTFTCNLFPSSRVVPSKTSGDREYVHRLKFRSDLCVYVRLCMYSTSGYFKLGSPHVRNISHVCSTCRKYLHSIDSELYFIPMCACSWFDAF